MITIQEATDTALEALTKAFEAQRHNGVNNFFGHAAGMIKRALSALEPWKPVHNPDIDRWHVRHDDGRWWCRAGSDVPTRHKTHFGAQKWADQLNKTRP